MAKRLIDKALDAAKAVVENQEGKPVQVRNWRTIDHFHPYKILVSVVVVEDNNYDATFDIWVLIDLNTEEIFVQE